MERVCTFRIKALGLLWILTLLFSTNIADEAVLLDTTLETQDNLDWQAYPSSTGWQEASFDMGNDDLVRVNAVCQIDQAGSKNWLRTPFIPRGSAKRLYIEMKFTMRECSEYPDPKSLQQCKETFNLLYYEAESDYANSVLPRWDTLTYRHIDVIAADSKFSHINNAVINTEVRSVAINQKGVYFAFLDAGACTTLISVRIYYKKCTEVTLNFAHFVDTSTGAEATSIQRATGQCVKNSAMKTQPSYLCKANGEWYLNTGGCECLPGYMPSMEKCIACSRNTYKFKTGNIQCAICPTNSHAPTEHSVQCQCFDGFYRSTSDLARFPCTKPPSPPRNLSVDYVDQSSVVLKWQQPTFNGGRKDVFYHVECRDCGSVAYTPGMTDFNHTRVTITGLKPRRKYKVIIYARNGVSTASRTDWDFYDRIEFTTEAGNAARDLNVGSTSTNGHFTLTMLRPNIAEEVEMFEIRYYPAVHPDKKASVLTKDLRFVFKNLTGNTQYAFQIRYKTASGWSEYTSVHYFKTVLDQAADATPMGIIAGSIVAVAVCISIVIIMIIIFWRRNNQGCSEKNPNDCENLQYTNTIGKGPLMTVPLFTSPGSVRSYVDPHTYEDPHQAVREFTKEIDASHITIESVIGGGEFGDVCKGKLRMPGHPEMCVAIKTLKPGASEKNRLDFLTEASIMGQFEDANVIALEGVVTKSHPIMIVTEYMENGSLDSFLRNNDGQFTVMQLVGMLRGIASGMKYLSEMGYVHRDLAARNILANENLVCKVADFGLSREIESDDTDGAYTTKGGKIPVRWTAPEAIAYRKFTSASDVWSYGVVMWEVMSYGERPYWNWSNQDVIKAVEKGYRLPPPMDCPEAIHQLMLDCWQKERSHRSKFAAIVRTIDKLIRAPELLRKVAKPRPYNTYESTAPDLTRFETIEDWLVSIKMERYLDYFLQNGYAHMDIVSKISLKDLINMGITLVGHQKKLMNSVQTMRVQLHGATISDGFMV